MLIMVVLNSWSGNSNIPAMSDSSLALSYQSVFLDFGMPYNFFLDSQT